MKAMFFDALARLETEVTKYRRAEEMMLKEISNALNEWARITHPLEDDRDFDRILLAKIENPGAPSDFYWAEAGEPVVKYGTRDDFYYDGRGAEIDLENLEGNVLREIYKTLPENLMNFSKRIAEQYNPWLEK